MSLTRAAADIEKLAQKMPYQERSRGIAAADHLRETELEMEAIKAIVGALARRADLTIDDIGLPTIEVRANPTAVQQREKIRQIAARILSGKQ